jgi:hypothetical protein
MRRCLTILLLCVYATGQSNAFRPDIVQSAIKNDPSGGNVPYNDNVTSGNLLAGCVTWYNAGLTLAVSDTLGTSYSYSSVVTVGATQHYVQMWYGVAPSSGANTVTVGGLTGAHLNAGVAEFTNISGTLDTSGSNNSGASPTSMTVSVTTTVNGDLLLPCAALSDRNQMQYYAAFPQQFAVGTGGGSAGPMTMFFENTGLAGSQSVTDIPNIFKSGTPATMGMIVLAFKPSAIAVTSSTLPHGAQTAAYKATLTAVGGAGAYTYSASGLPGWASLNTATGAITGTPNINGCTNVGFTVTDGSITSSTRTLALCVGSSFGTISLVQHATNVYPGAATLTGVSSGNIILVGGWGPEQFGQNNYVFASDTGQSGQFTDSLGTVFHQVRPVTSLTGAVGNGAPTVVYIGCTTANGNDSITSIVPFPVEAEEWTNMQTVVDDGTNAILAGASVSPLSVTTGNYTAQVANETLWEATTGRNVVDDSYTLTGFTPVFNGDIGGTGLLFADGYLGIGAAGTYTSSVSLTSVHPDNGAIALQLIGLRPEIAGLGCSGTPIATPAPRHKGWVF